MKNETAIWVFGEVLFDVFPDGQALLGGAPFNVAWHLQALGDAPLLVSRVGDDQAGRDIRQAMAGWQMAMAGVQGDAVHPSGRVEVAFANGEPDYRIVADCAYDFIAADGLPVTADGPGLLYHGTLALRSPVSRGALDVIRKRVAGAVFVDVNLRTPWWQKELVQDWLHAARWVKLNKEELALLGGARASLEAGARDLVSKYELEQLIVTCGGDGAFVCTAAGAIHRVTPPVATRVVDTVGAGDAFTAVYLHALLHGWEVARALDAAQRFACEVVGLRGATSRDPGFYQHFLQDLQDS